jgi:two-component system sensor histidine kinase YesM
MNMNSVVRFLIFQAIRFNITGIVLTNITIALAFCSVLFSGLLAFWLTKKNYRQVFRIIQTLNSASAGKEETAKADKVTDLYGLIIHNILNTFLQQKYLKVQLSERKFKEQVLELRALQSQINPHFLNNTLHSIYWKSLELTRSPNEVSLMIEQLSDMLDYAVRASDELVTLEEELVYCRSYLRIQQTRYPGRIEVIWDADESWEACKVLKLGLQPIIENSIQYGLENRKLLRIKVKFRMNDSSVLKITVLDNGAGITQARMRDIEALLSSDTERADHVGLLNTYKRLGLKYDAASMMRILSKPEYGTAVTLLFPQK